MVIDKPDNVNDRDWEIYLCRHRDGMTFRSIGGRFGLTGESVRRISNKVNRKRIFRDLVKLGHTPEDALRKIREGKEDATR